MSVDKALESALRDAIRDHGQPEKVAKRLLAWLDALSLGEKNDSRKLEYFEDLMESIDLGTSEDEN